MRKIFNYDPATGIFVWRVDRPPRGKAGNVAGHDNGRGYIKLSISGARYYAHRLAFLWMDGRYPNTVDHINGNPSDNRWANLRDTTQAINTDNRLANGVRFRYGRWYARHKDVHLGVFDSEQSARAAFTAAKVASVGFNPSDVRDSAARVAAPKRFANRRQLFDGKSLSQWAREIGISQPTLHHRIHVQGLSLSEAIKHTTKPSAEETHRSASRPSE